MCNTDNAGIQFLQNFAASDDANAQRPDPGKLVRVDAGKRKGAEGIVIRHIQDRFGDKWRYGSDMQQMLRDVRGRYGFRVQVQTDTHGTFWVDAENVTVL